MRNRGALAWGQRSATVISSGKLRLFGRGRGPSADTEDARGTTSFSGGANFLHVRRPAAGLLLGELM